MLPFQRPRAVQSAQPTNPFTHLRGLSFCVLYKSSDLAIECLLLGSAAKPGPPLTFIRLVDEVEQPLGLRLELRVSVLVGVVEHAQPAVGGFQLLGGGLEGEKPGQAAIGASSAPAPKREPIGHLPTRLLST